MPEFGMDCTLACTCTIRYWKHFGLPWKKFNNQSFPLTLLQPCGFKKHFQLKPQVWGSPFKLQFQAIE